MSVSTYTRYSLSRAERRRREREIRERVEADRRRVSARRRAEAESRRAAEAAGARKVAELPANLARAARELDRAVARRTSRKGGARGGERGAGELAGRLASAIESVPEDWRVYMGGGLSEVERILARAAAGGYDDVYAHALEMAGHRLSGLMARAPALAREHETAGLKALERAASIEEKLTPVQEGSPLEQERRGAAELMATARRILSSGDKVYAATALERLESEADAMLADYRETLLRVEEREYVHSQVIEVLGELGYEPLDLWEGEEGKAGGVSRLAGPGGSAVRVELGLDEAIRCELEVPEGEGREAHSGRWCSDFSAMLNALADRDLEIEEYWRSEAGEETGGHRAFDGEERPEEESAEFIEPRPCERRTMRGELK